MVDDFPPGMVWLVGAGPGDPELLTGKAVRLIQRADVVFHDALVGPEILDLIPLRAERVSVGKRAGRHSKDQRTINAMLVAAAGEGLRVVRLKGGDPSLFGRSAEEMMALRTAGLPMRVCPGITAASAAAASAGVSLTLRGTARDVRFVTAHSRNGAALDLDWDGLARSGTTLAFYMARGAAGRIAHSLMAAGMDGATPVLIAREVSLAGEGMFFTRLDLLGITARSFSADAPTIVIVGQAMERSVSVTGHKADKAALPA